MPSAILSRVQVSFLLLPDAILSVCGILIPPSRTDIFMGFPSSGDFTVHVGLVHVAAFPWTPVSILKVMFPAGVNSWLEICLAMFIANTYHLSNMIYEYLETPTLVVPVSSCCYSPIKKFCTGKSLHVLLFSG